MNKYHGAKGFTLIELLVVVSIIAFVSSIIFATTTFARTKAVDARKVVEAGQVQVALHGYYNDKGTMPPNYTCTSGSCVPGGSAFEMEDTANPTNPQTASGQAYNASMQHLVNGGYLSSIPHSPDKTTPYGYYNFGPNTAGGAMFITTLQTTTPSASGTPNSCRPVVQYDTEGNIITPMIGTYAAGPFRINPTAECTPPLTPSNVRSCVNGTNFVSPGCSDRNQPTCAPDSFQPFWYNSTNYTYTGITYIANSSLWPNLTVWETGTPLLVSSPDVYCANNPDSTDYCICSPY